MSRPLNDPSDRSISRLLSRRNALLKILGSAGGVGAVRTLTNAQTVSVPGLDPQWQQMIENEQANSKNQAVIFNAEKGLVVTFGDHLFHFSLPTAEFEVFKGQTRVLSGTSKSSYIGNANVPKVGDSLTEIDTIQSANGTGIRVQARVALMDSSNCLYQFDIAAGLLNGNPTFWCSSVYNYCMGYFPQGFSLSGVPPDFDLSLLTSVGRILASHKVPRMFTNPPIVIERVSPPSEPVIEISLSGAIKAIFDLPGECRLGCVGAELGRGIADALGQAAADVAGVPVIGDFANAVAGYADSTATSLETKCRRCLVKSAMSLGL